MTEVQNYVVLASVLAVVFVALFALHTVDQLTMREDERRMDEEYRRRKREERLLPSRRRP